MSNTHRRVTASAHRAQGDRRGTNCNVVVAPKGALACSSLNSFLVAVVCAVAWRERATSESTSPTARCLAEMSINQLYSIRNLLFLSSCMLVDSVSRRVSAMHNESRRQTSGNAVSAVATQSATKSCTFFSLEYISFSLSAEPTSKRQCS
jgi:hypothetical protein